MRIQMPEAPTDDAGSAPGAREESAGLFSVRTTVTQRTHAPPPALPPCLAENIRLVLLDLIFQKQFEIKAFMQLIPVSKYWQNTVQPQKIPAEQI